MLSLLIRSIRSLSQGERRFLAGTLFIFILAMTGSRLIAYYENTTVGPAQGGEYIEGMTSQPVAINPVLVASNPVDRDLVHLLFAPLRTLTESITPSPDYEMWSIVLKENLSWSDGEPLGAEDVRFTIKTILDPDAHSPIASAWTDVTIEVISSREFRLTLNEPYAFFESTLDDLRIIPEHIFGAIPAANFRLSDYNLEPVGSGPYRFVGYDKRNDGFISRYVMEQNPFYAGEAAFIPSVTIVFFTKEDDLAEAFNARRITGFGTENVELIQKIQITKTISRLPLTRYHAVFMNVSANESLKEFSVRRALDRAVDREDIIASVFLGNADTAYGPLVPGIEGYEATSTATSSLDDARAALEKAGWKLGEDGIRSKKIGKAEVKLEFNLIFPKTPTLEATAKILEGRWTAIGALVRSTPLTQDEITSALRTRSYQMLMLGNILPGSDLYDFWHSSKRFFPGLNFALYQNAKVDALLEKARKDPDPLTRAESIKQASDLIVADAPAIFLFNPSYLFVTAPKLLGVPETTVQTPSNRFDSVASWYLRTGRVFE